MKPVSSLQLYVYTGGRWELHAAFKENEREDAIAEAKDVLGSGRVSSVRVLLETYDPRTNSQTDRTVFFSSRKGDKAAPSLSHDTSDIGRGAGVVRKTKRGPMIGGGRIAGGARAAPKPKKKTKEGVTREGIAKKLAAAVGIAIVTGLAVAFLVFLSVPSQTFGSLPFLAFTISFVFAVVAAAWVLLDQQEIRAITMDEKASRGMVRAKPLAASARKASVGREDEPALDDLGALKEEAEALAKRERERSEQESKSESLLAEIAKELDDEDAAEARAGDPLAGLLGDDEPKVKKPRNEKKKEKKKEPEPDPGLLDSIVGDEDDGEDEKTDLVRTASQDIVKFMGASLGYAAKNSVHAQENGFDQYNMFGVHLYMAGAATAYTEKERVPRKLLGQIVERSNALFSGDAQRARRFVATYAEYLNDPKNMGMFNKGHEALMKARQISDEANGQSLVWAFDDWNKKREQNVMPVAIMFTDIANSTAFTQQHGDEESHKMVSAHNAIVREALRKYTGHEVKHMGDGIMAVFRNPAKAVPAGIVMMRGVDFYNSTAKLPFKIRISISVGEAVEEKGDFFGSIVQLSARINSMTDPDQILVSEPVKDASKGLAVFAPYGKHSFKGFPEPVGVFEVPWREDGRLSKKAMEVAKSGG